MRKLALTLVTLPVLACGQEPTAAPAIPEISAAARADILRFPDHVVGFFVGSCTGFDILSDWDAEVQVISIVDTDGSVVREQILYHLIGSSTYYNSADPELVLFGGPAETQNLHLNWVDGWALSAGPVWRIVVPGYGPIFVETGVTKFDLTTGTITHNSGHNQYLDGDFAALCAALAP